MRCSIAFSLLLLAAASFGAEPALTLKREGVETRRLTAAELGAFSTGKDVTVQDPVFGKTKRYRCWPVRELLDAVLGAGWGAAPLTEAVLTANDGFSAPLAIDRLREDGACLAFADLDAEPGRWEKAGLKQADPGPFYLVWTRPDQRDLATYPWAYALASIDLVRFESRYHEVPPRGVGEGTPAYKGYLLFRAQCLRCHSINREGGKIGPDLNAPQSVTAYRSKKWFKAYVKKPSTYRYTEMPDHPGLSDADLEALWAYFSVKARQPEKGW